MCFHSCSLLTLNIVHRYSLENLLCIQEHSFQMNFPLSIFFLIATHTRMQIKDVRPWAASCLFQQDPLFQDRGRSQEREWMGWPLACMLLRKPQWGCWCFEGRRSRAGGGTGRSGAPWAGSEPRSALRDRLRSRCQHSAIDGNAAND